MKKYKQNLFLFTFLVFGSPFSFADQNQFGDCDALVTERTIPTISLYSFYKNLADPSRLTNLLEENNRIFQIRTNFDWLRSIAQKFNGPKALKLATMPNRVVFVGDGEWAKSLAKQDHKLSNQPYRFFDVHKNIGENALMVSEDKAWSETHEALQPIFAKRNVRTLFQKQIREEVQRSLDLFKNGNTLELQEFSIFLAKAIIYRAVTGLELTKDVADKVFSEDRRMREHVERHFENLNWQINSIAGHLEQERIKLNKSHSWWLDQITNLLFNGQITARDAIRESLIYLGRDANAQVIFSSAVTEKNLDDRENFVKEILRQRIIVPLMVTRLAIEDIRLGPYLVKKGSWIVLHTWSIHENRADWPKATSFSPQQNEQDPPRAQSLRFCPFGFGQRACIGQHFVMLELEMVLAEFANHFRIEVDKNDSKKLILTKPQF